MKNKNTFLIRRVISASFLMLVAAASIFALPVVRNSAGSTPQSITPTITLFRQDLGGVYNGEGNSYTSGRREITWDEVPDNYATPNVLPGDFYNVNSPRGVVLSTPCNILDSISVSSSASTNIQPRFGDVHPSYTGNFQPDSLERMAAVTAHYSECNEIDVTFYIPGTRTPATVNGFGAIFSDIETAGAGMLALYGEDGKLLPGGRIYPTATTNGGFTFAGATFNGGERIARVRIFLSRWGLRVADLGTSEYDVVALDNIIYGEPRAIGQHASDFDGDGTSDLAVFRPSVGAWYVMNSGSNTFTSAQFGMNGDVPTDGDFDGDSRNDIAVFRPADGNWYLLKSTTGQFDVRHFGQAGDKPVAGDYDKDGRTDIAVWRPADGNYYINRSSNAQFEVRHWGQNGDIPIGASTP